LLTGTNGQRFGAELAAFIVTARTMAREARATSPSQDGEVGRVAETTTKGRKKVRRPEMGMDAPFVTPPHDAAATDGAHYDGVPVRDILAASKSRIQDFSGEVRMTGSESVALLNAHFKMQLASAEARATGDRDPVSGVPRGKRYNAVPFIHGQPGIGKTWSVRKAAELAGYAPPIVVPCAELLPDALTGPPFPTFPDLPEEVNGLLSDMDEPFYHDFRSKFIGTTTFLPPKQWCMLTKSYWRQKQDLFRVLQDQGEISPDCVMPEPPKYVLFLDEYPNAQDDTRVVLRTVVNERRIGFANEELLDTVAIVAAGNRQEHGAFVAKLDAPDKSRFAPQWHQVVVPYDWYRIADATNIDPIVQGYIRSKEGLPLTESTDLRDAGHGFANPAGWEKIGRLLPHLRQLNWPDEWLMKDFVGTVGERHGTAFFNFYRTSRRAPSIRDIVSDPYGTPVPDPRTEYDLQLVITENIRYAGMIYPEWIFEQFPDRREALRTLLGNMLRYAKRLQPQLMHTLVPRLIGGDAELNPETVMFFVHNGDLMEELVMPALIETSRAIDNMENAIFKRPDSATKPLPLKKKGV
jgi:hypothetical protein